MSEDAAPPDEPDRAAELRAQIDEARAHLAATAEALAARATSEPVVGKPVETAPSNLPVLYRPNEARRSATVAGAVVGVVVLALRLRRRLRR